MSNPDNLKKAEEFVRKVATRMNPDVTEEQIKKAAAKAAKALPPFK